MSGAVSSAPIIDIEPISVQRKTDSIDKTALNEIGRQMKDALQKYGFFYAKNHGISIKSVEEIMSSAKEFFQEPLEVKQPYFRGDKGVLGWISMGSERSNQEDQADLKETFNFHPADGRNEYMQTDFNTKNKHMFSGCSDLALRVLDALSVALGFEQGRLREVHKSIGKNDNQTFLRNLFYPPIPYDLEVGPGTVRLGEHADYGTVTLNFQDNAGGLDMNTPSMGCLPVTPIPGTVVVFVGKQMQQLTADTLIAGKHKILVPKDEAKARQPRQSMVFFARADDYYIIKCLDGSDKYQPVSSVDFLKYRQMEDIVQ